MDTLRHLSALGEKAYFIFSFIIAAFQEQKAASNGWLVAMSGYSDKTLATSLTKLENLGYIVRSPTGGWLPSPGRQAALRGVATALPESGQMVLPLPQAEVLPDYEKNQDGISDSYVVVGVVKESTYLSNTQQQQTNSPVGNSDSPAAEPARARALLLKARVWRNLIPEIEQADYGCVLGWVAYCADPENGIKNAPALIAKNLKVGHEPPTPYMPPRVCGVCHHAQCDCAEQELEYPAAFDALAFLAPPTGWGADRADWLARRWVCPACDFVQCRCNTE